jgi:thioredoxin 1
VADVKELSDAGFEAEVLRASQPVLVDFWGPGCPPCMAIAPVIKELATLYAGKAVVCKMNVAENFATASEYSISGIPTLMIFKNGQVVARFMGAQPKARLQAALDEALA